jgi:hypothetical protein
MKLPGLFANASLTSSSFLLAGLGRVYGPAVQYGRTLRLLAVGSLPAVFLLRTTREEIYNILWALVFGFATLNILSLGARHFEHEKGGLSFGEVMAILVVLVSVVLLGWELLYVFNILPIRLNPS